MRPVLFACATALTVAFVSCSKSVSELTPTDEPITVSAPDVNLALLDKDAVEYYKDIAVMAEWYADHPAVMQAALTKNTTSNYTDSTYNSFVAELAELELYDEKDQPVSFFKLDEAARHAFLKDYVKLEAQFLDSKFKMAGTEQIDDAIESVNAIVDKTVSTPAYSDSFDFDAAAARIGSSNPYEQVNKALLLNLRNPAPERNEGTSGGEQAFFRLIVNSGILGYSVVTFNQIALKNTPQNFVDKLRNHIKKGRVLVALPGGFVTASPMAFNGTTFDVGHVAIVSKDASELPSSIKDDFTFTIGTNSEDNMHHEKIAADWTGKHGMSYLMQPIKVSYHYKTKGGFFPWYERRQEDVDNTKTYQKITQVMGKSYCRWDEMLYAKWKAPDRFICSSSAWWAIKEAHGVGIGDFYKPTIFPAGVYESSDMRVVAQSW